MPCSRASSATALATASAGCAIGNLLISMGFGDVVMCDINGIICEGDQGLNAGQEAISHISNRNLPGLVRHGLGHRLSHGFVQNGGNDTRGTQEEVVIAQVKQNAKASNIARVISLMAGFPEEIPSYTLMMQCGSSMQSVHCAANDIRCGELSKANSSMASRWIP